MIAAFTGIYSDAGTWKIWDSAWIIPFELLGIIVTVASLRWKIRLFNDKSHFIYTTWYGRSNIIKYEDIIDVNDNLNHYVIKTSNKSFNIDKHAINIEFFFTLLEQKVKEDVLKKKYAIIRLSRAYLWIGILFIVIFMGSFAVLLVLSEYVIDDI